MRRWTTTTQPRVDVRPRSDARDVGGAGEAGNDGGARKLTVRWMLPDYRRSGGKQAATQSRHIGQEPVAQSAYAYPGGQPPSEAGRGTQRLTVQMQTSASGQG